MITPNMEAKIAFYSIWGRNFNSLQVALVETCVRSTGIGCFPFPQTSGFDISFIQFPQEACDRELQG
jgi:hypothetical protein